MKNFNKIFADSNILITGHTGFKGSWLSAWLKLLGANLIGVSDKICTSPSHYNSISGIFDKNLFKFFAGTKVPLKLVNPFSSLYPSIRTDILGPTA